MKNAWLVEVERVHVCVYICITFGGFMVQTSQVWPNLRDVFVGDLVLKVLGTRVPKIYRSNILVYLSLNY